MTTSKCLGNGGWLVMLGLEAAHQLESFSQPNDVLRLQAEMCFLMCHFVSVLYYSQLFILTFGLFKDISHILEEVVVREGEHRFQLKLFLQPKHLFKTTFCIIVYIIMLEMDVPGTWAAADV